MILTNFLVAPGTGVFDISRDRDVKSDTGCYVVGRLFRRYFTWELVANNMDRSFDDV